MFKTCLLCIYTFTRVLCQEPVFFNLVRRPGWTVREQRRLSVLEGNLYGSFQSTAVFYADITVGTPGQLISVIVDTGSSITAFPCTDCGANCGVHMDPPFDASKSSTFKWSSCDRRCHLCGATGECRYSVTYAEGSMIAGRMFQDVLQLGLASQNNAKGRAWLGCHSNETKSFLTQKPNGIMGLWNDGFDTDVLTLLSTDAISRQLIVLCLSQQGGVLGLGGFNTSWIQLDTPLQWISYTGHYYVTLTGFQLSTGSSIKTVLNQNMGAFMMDSATTFAYLLEVHVNAIKTAVRNACQSQGVCVGAVALDSPTEAWMIPNRSSLSTFPDLLFTLGSATSPYRWKADGYLYLADASQNVWRFALHAAETSQDIVLGASFMVGHAMVFDRYSQSIGFADSKCPSVENRSTNVPLYPDSKVNITLPSAASSSLISGSSRNAALSFIRACLLLALIGSEIATDRKSVV